MRQGDGSRTGGNRGGAHQRPGGGDRAGEGVPADEGGRRRAGCGVPGEGNALRTDRFPGRGCC